MIINEIIIYVIITFMILGAIDKCLGYKFGLGKKFDEGFHAMGPLALAVVGMVSIAPVLVKILKPVIIPFYSFLGADPAMFAGTILANDMGGYPLAMGLAQNPSVGLFSGLILGSMMGATIVFTIPVALGIIKKEDKKFFTIGILFGIIAIPFGCLVGGLVAGFGLSMVLLNLIPVIIFSLLIVLGLWRIPKIIIKGFVWFSKGIVVLITLSTAAIVFETLTGIVIIPGMAPIWDGIKIVGAIGIILLGAFPMIYVITEIFKKPFARFGKILGVNEVAIAGMLVTLANNIPMFNLFKDMDNKGKILNIAFAVSAAFVLGDHLGFTAGVSREMIFPMIMGKISGGILAIIIANFILTKTKILNNVKQS